MIQAEDLIEQALVYRVDLLVQIPLMAEREL
jgi:hypothetical protein